MKTGVWFARYVVLPVQAVFALFQVSLAALAFLLYDTLSLQGDPVLQPVRIFCVQLAATFIISGFAVLFLALRLGLASSVLPAQWASPPFFRALFALGLVTLAVLVLAACWPLLQFWLFTGQLLHGLGLLNSAGATSPAAGLVAGLLFSFPAAATLAGLSALLFAAFVFTLIEEPRRVFLSAAFSAAITPVSFLVAAWFAIDLSPHLDRLLGSLDSRFAWRSFALEWERAHRLPVNDIAHSLTLLLLLYAGTLVLGSWYRLRAANENEQLSTVVPAPHGQPNLSLLAQPEPAPEPPPAPLIQSQPRLGPEWEFDAYQVLPGRMMAPAFFEDAKSVLTFDNALFQLRQSGPLLDASGAPVLQITKRALSGATFEIEDVVIKVRLGSFERGAILDPSGAIIGRVQELERNANVARYQLWLGETVVASFTHYPGLANSELDADFSADTTHRLDRRLGLALALILRSRPAPSQ